MFEISEGRPPCGARCCPGTSPSSSHKPTRGTWSRPRSPTPTSGPRAGTLSILVKEIELAGDGELLRRRQQLIARFEREGLTDLKSSRPSAVPACRRRHRRGRLPGTRDVLAGLEERFPVARVFTACCQVQGAGAPNAVIEAIAALEMRPDVDVIVVTRGGGSVKDLAAFDNERLCRAIRAIETPVITAIGHTENDPVCNQITHAAYVPRHAAEYAVPDRGELLGRAR